MEELNGREVRVGKDSRLNSWQLNILHKFYKSILLCEHIIRVPIKDLEWSPSCKGPWSLILISVRQIHTLLAPFFLASFPFLVSEAADNSPLLNSSPSGFYLRSHPYCFLFLFVSTLQNLNFIAVQATRKDNCLSVIMVTDNFISKLFISSHSIYQESREHDTSVSKTKESRDSISIEFFTWHSPH